MKSSFTFSVILLSGGIGSRVGLSTPKQFLPLQGKPVACYSFDLLKKLSPKELVVVCEPCYQHYFLNNLFAHPGKTRQESLSNGFNVLNQDVDIILIHDSARPFLKKEDVYTLLQETFKIGAAALGVPCSSTLKICDSNLRVLSTPNRDSLWEIQTPQALKTTTLKAGLEKAAHENIYVTDDLSLAELLHLPVTVVKGSPMNFKITTLKDLQFAQFLLDQESL